MKTITTLFATLITAITVQANTVEITSTTLSAASNENMVTLHWTASNESGNTRYEIERSFYSNNFNTVVTLQVPFTGNTVKNYRINDNAAALTGREIAYYRVKQIDANGTVTYSNTMIVALKNNAAGMPESKAVLFSADQNGTAVVTLKNITGQVSAVITAAIAKGNNSVEFNKSLPKGMYVAEIAVNGVVTQTQKIIAE
ncbi:MAG TPA: T9SS type A sorting domain-containing protein [Ferruginibacter sp.]|nr:T9SS type A sorting domain-containing protein [Ferruginibacter sp.]HMP21842.1 T9SS type A sorting domain-containing protein [Ferruginibacter sp.]